MRWRIVPDPVWFFYHLPYPLKVAVASMQGWRLRYWRYASQTAEIVKEAWRMERFDRSEIQAWQAARLRRLLRRAAETVPYYRKWWSSHGSAGSRRISLDLQDWPILGKEELRRNPGAFLVDGAKRRRLFSLHTSGSTGTPLHLWISRRDLQRWYGLFEARWRGWYGVSRFDRWAILGGQLVVEPGRTRPPFWVWNRGLRQLYLSAYHLTRESALHYIHALQRHRVVYVLGYPSGLFELAREVLAQGLEPPDLRVVISNAEPLRPHQRDVISRAFRCPVRDTYGMAEMVAAAGECEHGTMHLWPEAGIVEVLDEKDRPVSPGEAGRLVCTGLINGHMPLIRYEVGDRGVLAPPGKRCPCGRTLPILLGVEGRIDDVVVTPDGRRVGRLDTVFKSDLPIVEAQVVQESLAHLTVKVVEEDGFDERTRAEIAARLRERVGPMNIRVQSVPGIPRGPNGKFRAVVSRIHEADGLMHVESRAGSEGVGSR